MTEPIDPFDFWYAVNNTEILQRPSQRLETFGATLINYKMISQELDSLEVKVREGKLQASRPEIITPNSFGELPLEGFGESEAAKYTQWLQENAQHLRLLQYGFVIKKEEIKTHVSTDSFEQVMDNVMAEATRKDDPLGAVITGVESPWEVCLLKLMVDVVERSAPQHVQDFQSRNMLPRGQEGIRHDIEDEFLAASRDSARIPYLHKRLETMGVFSEYEDRFYALVRASKA